MVSRCNPAGRDGTNQRLQRPRISSVFSMRTDRPSLQLSTGTVETRSENRYRLTFTLPAKLFTSLTTQKGSLQRPRKRLRESRTQTEKLIPARSPSQENPETTENPASDPSGPSPNGRCSCDKGSSPSGRERASPKATTETDEWSTRRRDSQLNIHDLSFILHPSHEASTPEKEQNAPPSRGVIDQEPVLIARACSALGVTQEILKQM